MSEWSESYHIRTDEPDVTAQKLVDAGIDGYIFTPKNGWLSFVPHDPDEKLIGGALTDELIAMSGKPVLNYVSNDLNWGFEYKLPEALAEADRGKSHVWFQYDCQFDFDENLRDEQGNLAFADFDHAAFCRVLGRPDIETKLKNILQIVDLSEVDEDEYPDSFDAAWKFGAALGLPIYEYFSSRYVQHDPQNFVEHGVRRIGSEPMTWRAAGSVPKAGQSATAPSKKPGGVLGLLRLLKGGKN